MEGEARLSSVLCMGIGSTVERSLVALAQCFSLFAHPWYGFNGVPCYVIFGPPPKYSDPRADPNPAIQT